MKTPCFEIANASDGKMAELQAKRLKPQEESEKERRKERKNLLKFHREEAGRKKQHELPLAKMYMEILGISQSSFAQQPPVSFGQFQGMSSQQEIAFQFTPTAASNRQNLLRCYTILF